ncbi:MAG: hypothetical protein ACRBBP_06895 [Bdellovibrionales bacterium]
MLHSLLISFFVLNAYAGVENPRFSFLGGKYDNGYPKHKYTEVLDVVKGVYGPIIKSKGGSFYIQEDWFDGAVNMWAFRLGSEYWLEIPGGMSRYSLINEEAFITSICHELGHLLGGEPKRGEISLEGQSDYYATQDCVQSLLLEIKPFKDLAISPGVLRLCGEDLLCGRVFEGALSLTSYYAELEGVSPPLISKKSQVQVKETLKTHPPAQCRLDTLYAGYYKEPRPSCWYKKSK